MLVQVPAFGRDHCCCYHPIPIRLRWKLVPDQDRDRSFRRLCRRDRLPARVAASSGTLDTISSDCGVTEKGEVFVSDPNGTVRQGGCVPSFGSTRGSSGVNGGYSMGAVHDEAT